MAGIINGVWSRHHVVPSDAAEPLDNWVTHDGAPGPTGRGGFAAESGRYHYYFCRGCPNCHRVTISLALLRQSGVFSLSYVSDVKRDTGWRFDNGGDPLFSAASLQDVMTRAEGDLTARCTVPLLLDKKTKRIVSAQSADMVRMMDVLAVRQTGKTSLLWPETSAIQIDELNAWIAARIGGGVYQILFAESEAARRQKNRRVVEALQEVNRRLAGSRFLFGARISASDLWLFPALLRIDSIYSEIFGLSAKVADFPNLRSYLQDLWEVPEFRCASDLDPIESHYFESLIYGPGTVFDPGSGRKPEPAKRMSMRPATDRI